MGVWGEPVAGWTGGLEPLGHGGGGGGLFWASGTTVERPAERLGRVIRKGPIRGEVQQSAESQSRVQPLLDFAPGKREEWVCSADEIEVRKGRGGGSRVLASIAVTKTCANARLISRVFRLLVSIAQLSQSRVIILSEKCARAEKNVTPIEISARI